jgi:(1->4)-alpha-D-glucan 1-alpha-D-glucosylmutase
MPAAVQVPTPLAVTLRVIELVRERQARPTATYRLQLHKGFTLFDAAAIVPYLHDLGISHVYCSPYLRARTGSTHGYDTCDHSQINPELGGEAGYRQFVGQLAERGMGHILDMVPNHMAASTQNPWWYDVLENGPNSPYAYFFDVDWRPIKPELADKLLLPILGSQYGAVLEEHQLKIVFHEGAFSLRYYDNELPLSPKSVVPILQHKIGELRASLGSEHPEMLELESIITSLEHLPPQTARDLASIRERQREKEVIKRRLRDLTAASDGVRAHVERAVADFCDPTGGTPAIDRLDHLLNEQAYRLSHWRAAFDEINYRRFFDINELAAISMELPEVFWRSHALIRTLLAEGSLSGLRIDHIDGLFDPERYLLDLQWAYLADLGQLSFQKLLAEAQTTVGVADEPSGSNEEAAPPLNEHGAWLGAAPEVLRLCCEQVGLPPPRPQDLWAIFGPDTLPALAATDALSAPAIRSHLAEKQPLYVLTEKILGPDEPLPDTWPVAGTTGYDFLTTLNGLFVSPHGWDEIVRAYQRFTDDDTPYEHVVQDSKRLILRVAMASELQMLAHRLNRLSEQHRRSRDLTLNMLRYAAREVLVSFPVYRVYPSRDGVSDRDRRFVDLAVAKAKRQNKAFAPAVFDFVRDVLLLNHPPGLSPEAISERETLAGKFQQVTSPVMAKGVEDTSFYVWVPLASVNEVGGDPRLPTTSLKAFHDQNVERASRYRQAMLATTTHDTKRTEDVRARLNVLSEIPGEWRNAVQRFARINKRWRRDIEGEPAPSLKDENLCYQSLVGIWPVQPPSAEECGVLVERLQGYMEKATHEAKQRTSWINPSPAYDEAVREFVAKTLRYSPQNRFLVEVQAFCERIAAAGQYNALSQLVIKLLSPGVPDIYQGQELWDYSLVDPDNRRPVDYDQRRRLLAEISGSSIPEGLSLHDPRLKLLVTERLLHVRRKMAHLWADGDYVSLEGNGPLAEHLVAFAWRGKESERFELVAVVPRFVQKLIDQQRQDAPEQPLVRGLCSTFWRGTTLSLPSAGGVAATNAFSGQTIPLVEEPLDASVLFADLPVAVLTL